MSLRKNKTTIKMRAGVVGKAAQRRGGGPHERALCGPRSQLASGGKPLLPVLRRIHRKRRRMRRCGHGGCNPRLQRLSRGRSGRLAMRAGLGAVRCAQEARLKSPGDCAALDRGGDRDSGLLPRPQKKSAHFKAARQRGRRLLEAPRSAGRGGGLPGARVGGVALAAASRAAESGLSLFFRK